MRVPRRRVRWSLPDKFRLRTIGALRVADRTAQRFACEVCGKHVGRMRPVPRPHKKTARAPAPTVERSVAGLHVRRPGQRGRDAWRPASVPTTEPIARGPKSKKVAIAATRATDSAYLSSRQCRNRSCVRNALRLGGRLASSGAGARTATCAGFAPMHCLQSRKRWRGAA